MRRVDMVVGFAGSAVWLILAMAVVFGAQPNKWVVFISFLATAASLLRSGMESRLEMWKERLEFARSDR